MFGISAALTTPFTGSGDVDLPRLQSHVEALAAAGCRSFTLFGTTGEGPSIPTDERHVVLRRLIEAGISPDSLVLAMHGCAADDIVQQVSDARHLGVETFLLPPPCYYEDPPAEGLRQWFAEVIGSFRGTPARFILYHIPQVIGVGIPPSTIAALKAAFSENLVGVKDSSGSLENALALLKMPGLEILIGDERLLATCARQGASGAISGIANLFPERLVKMLQTGEADADIDRLVDAITGLPVTPAIKALVAHRYRDKRWQNVRAPLESTPREARASLAQIHDMIASAGEIINGRNEGNTENARTRQ